MKQASKMPQRFAVLLTAAALTAGFSMSLPKISLNPAPITAFAADDDAHTDGSNGTLRYSKYSDHIEVYGLASETDNLVIPETIDGLPVTKVAMYAFELGTFKSITFPDSIKEIDSYCFSDCKNLTEVTLPASIERIGFHSFENCTSLKTINFPDHLVKTCEFTFENTPWLETQRQNGPFVVVNGALIDGRTCKGDITIPSGVKYVAAGAFSGNENITSAVFPTSVTEVADNTFWKCKNLKSVEIVGAERISIMAFGYCEKLSEIKMSKKLSSIDMYGFTDCTGSATITFYGKEDDWRKVEIHEIGNDFLKNARIVYDDSYVEKVEHDINMDGKFDIADAILLQKWLLAVPNTELKDWKAGDFNDDGKLTGVDFTLMKRALMKG